MSQRFRKLATALGGFAIGYTIGALATAASPPDQEISHEIDDAHIRRIVRREADKMAGETRQQWRRNTTDPNIYVGDISPGDSDTSNDGSLFMTDKTGEKMTWRRTGGENDGR